MKPTIDVFELTRCSDRPKSILEALKHDLDCGTSAADSIGLLPLTALLGLSIVVTAPWGSWFSLVYS